MSLDEDGENPIRGEEEMGLILDVTEIVSK